MKPEVSVALAPAAAPTHQASQTAAVIAALGPVRIVAGKAGWFTQEELNALDEQVETDPGYVYQAA